MYRVYFSIKVDGAPLDSCQKLKVDYDALIAAIAANANNSEIEISTKLQAELSVAIPLSYVQSVCFENKLTKADEPILTEYIAAVMSQTDAGN
jgi:hypothetical protein